MSVTTKTVISEKTRSPSVDGRQRKTTRSIKSPSTIPGSSVVSGSVVADADNDNINVAADVRQDVTGSSGGKARKSEVFIDSRGRANQSGKESKSGHSASPSVADDTCQSPLIGLLGPVLDEPLTSLGIKREEVLAGAAGGPEGAAMCRETRRQAARNRFRIPTSSLDKPDIGSPVGGGYPSRSDNGTAGLKLEAETPLGRREGCKDDDAEEVVVLLPLEVVLDHAILSVPHDESPTRIYELSEIWGEAVEQVRYFDLSVRGDVHGAKVMIRWELADNVKQDR